MHYFDQYKNLYLQAQTSGKYKMFLFEAKQKNENLKIYDSNQFIINFVNYVAEDLLKLEKKLNKKILHRHLESFENYDFIEDKDKVVLQKKQGKDLPKIYRFGCQNPILLTKDTVCFIILRDSISDEEFFSIVQKYKNRMIPRYDLRHAEGYYETDAWAEANQKLLRLHCMPVLEEILKKSKKILTTKNDLEK